MVCMLKGRAIIVFSLVVLIVIVFFLSPYNPPCPKRIRSATVFGNDRELWIFGDIVDSTFLPFGASNPYVERSRSHFLFKLSITGESNCLRIDNRSEVFYNKFSGRIVRGDEGFYFINQEGNCSIWSSFGFTKLSHDKSEEIAKELELAQIFNLNAAESDLLVESISRSNEWPLLLVKTRPFLLSEGMPRTVFTWNEAECSLIIKESINKDSLLLEFSDGKTLKSKEVIEVSGENSDTQRAKRFNILKALVILLSGFIIYCQVKKTRLSLG